VCPGAVVALAAALAESALGFEREGRMPGPVLAN
jgi:hypothetical protein